MNKKTAKKNIAFQNMNIILFNYDPYEVPADSLSNIECFDSLNNLLWIAEKPTTRQEAYYDMWVDESSNKLVAITGAGFKHEIDIQTGKILKSYLIK